MGATFPGGMWRQVHLDTPVVKKQTDPLHSKGQGQCWDCPAQTSPSKLSQTSQGASEGPDTCGLSTVCELHQVSNTDPKSTVILVDDHRLLELILENVF